MTDTSPSLLPDTLFRREDETPDGAFYATPRFVTHIDALTIEALTDFYREFLPPGSDVLDLMSSWVSHLPVDVSYGRVTGLGMNDEELRANPQLTDHVVHDLNRDPNVPSASGAYDRALLAVSIQYLTKPVEVMRSLRRSLRPTGRVCIAMSHRLFPTKAILAFRQLPPRERITLVGEYLARAGFENIEFVDRSPPSADPLWLVVGDVASQPND